jgi:hypothetical protein
MEPRPDDPHPRPMPQQHKFIPFANHEQEEAKRRVATAIGYFHNAAKRDLNGVRRCYLIPRYPILAPRDQRIHDLDNLDNLDDFDQLLPQIPLTLFDMLSPTTIICEVLPCGEQPDRSGPASGPFSYVEALGITSRTAVQLKRHFLGPDSLWQLHLYLKDRCSSEARLPQRD